MMTTEIREKFYGRFVQNAPLTRGDIELPVAIHDVREVSVLSIFIFFLYDNYCILLSVFLLLVLFIFFCAFPLSLYLALLALFSLSFALLKKTQKITPVMQVMFCLENCTHFCV